MHLASKIVMSTNDELRIRPGGVRAGGPRVEPFLNKAKVCINGQITRTAIILLGKQESVHYLVPAHPQLTWILKDKQRLGPLPGGSGL